jgi:predicted ATP-grasp superfamily ATP-dependent carboligase
LLKPSNEQKRFEFFHKGSEKDRGEKHLKLLVYEHISGGGCGDDQIPKNVLSEGFGMLRTIIADFKAAGHSVTTTLDPRILGLNPLLKADSIIPVSSAQEVEEKLLEILSQVDAAYIIAPETDDLLRSLVEVVEQAGVASLNCPAEVIEKVSNKIVFSKSLKGYGIRTPETLTFNMKDSAEGIGQIIRDKINFPVVFKPSNGVSCCGLSVVKNKEQVSSAVHKIQNETSNKEFLVEELINGTAASVSLFSIDGRSVPVSLNRQEVAIETPEIASSYMGGSVPFDSLLQNEAFDKAKRIVELFPGLRGYVGIDFILTGKEVVAIEVNPRLTTSYIGLRRVIDFNPAQAIINVVLKCELPTRVESCGYVFFSKVKTTTPDIDALQILNEMKEIISPPFPLSGDEAACAMIASYALTLNEAKLHFDEVKKRVNKINQLR